MNLPVLQYFSLQLITQVPNDLITLQHWYLEEQGLHYCFLNDHYQSFLLCTNTWCTMFFLSNLYLCPSWEEDPCGSFRGFYSCWGWRSEDVTLLKTYETNCDLWIWAIQIQIWIEYSDTKIFLLYFKGIVPLTLVHWNCLCLPLFKGSSVFGQRQFCLCSCVLILDQMRLKRRRF